MKKIFVTTWGWPLGVLLHYLDGVPPPPDGSSKLDLKSVKRVFDR